MIIRCMIIAFALASAHCGHGTPPPVIDPPDAMAPDAATDRDQDGVNNADDCAPDDATRWQMVPLHRDGDGEGVGAGAAEDTCMGADIPAGLAATGDDCDDADPATWTLRPGYLDEDGDGVGAGLVQDVCSGMVLPAGYAAAGGDCAPLDPAAWQLLAFRYRDADGDSHAVAQDGTVCSGAALPPGHSDVAQDEDCDDLDPRVFMSLTIYGDGDGDGVGAGAAGPACTDGSVPVGSSLDGSDCAPGDAAAWQVLAYAHVDGDGDGFTTPRDGALCAGAALPDPYRTAPSGNDCDDGDPALTRFVVLYADRDRDGVGMPPRAIPCLGPSLPAGFSMLGHDPDDADPTVTRDDRATKLILEIL